MMSKKFSKLNRSLFRFAPWLVVAGIAISAGAAFAGTTLEIVVYGSGTVLPASSIAACSESDCLGYTAPPEEWTWSVMYPKNYVGWGIGNGNPKKRVYLMVDGTVTTSARSGSLLVLSTGGLSKGPHVIQGMGYGMDGSTAVSTPITVCVNTPSPCQ